MSDISQQASAERPSRTATVGTRWPPSWNTMPHGISVGRYVDPEFQKLEYERLWSRVWQVAARVDEIPEPNNFTTYEIGDQSVLLVRVDRETIKAYHNACPHRGTALGQGCGAFASGRIICPFHGWRWDLSGKNLFVLERQEFRGGQLRDSDVALKEIKSAVFAGFVFINFNPNPEPSFAEFVAPVRQLLEDLAVSEMRHYWWRSIPVASNWKVAQEAFFEAYHVPATHPQLEKTAAEVIYGNRSVADTQFTHTYVAYEALPRGHGRFYAGANTPMAGNVQALNVDPAEAMAARLQLLVDGMDAQVLQENVDIVLSLRGRSIPSGSSLGAEYVKALYSTAAAEGRAMPKRTPEILGMWGGTVFIFPNFMVFPQAGNAMMYRARPHGTDPDRCTFEIFSTKSYPAAVKPPRATVQRVTDVSDPEQVRLIPRQDLGNIPRIQKGLHSHAMRQTWLASNHEKMILNMHQELDRYLRTRDSLAEV
jgi:phenylpropionate dioxygenase-like ring-hydroxylating dioxygenase large terminal subunit